MFTLYDKKKLCLPIIHVRNLKQTLQHNLQLQKVHKAIAFCQEAWLEPYIDINTEFRKKAKNDFDSYKLMNNAVFGKTMENVTKHRDIKLVRTDKKRSKLVSRFNYHTTK